MVKKQLPKLVATKIYKTGQTRGADNDVIYQNRVARTSTVLIPYEAYNHCCKSPDKDGKFVNGFIVLIKPEVYFSEGEITHLRKEGLQLSKNLLVFYETREQWENYPPLKNWKPASSRNNPLGGQYVARIPATTSEGKNKIIEGFNTSKMKGAGIRVYEYANAETVENCRIQLELLYWLCADIDKLIAKNYEYPYEVYEYIENLKQKARERGLYDVERLQKDRIIDKDGYTICPLCLKQLSALGFSSRIQQAEGRDVPDLTVTEVSLFHIKELRIGEYNHRPYNLGWGHHHCNVVVKDSGIEPTLLWMKDVLRRNNMLSE